MGTVGQYILSVGAASLACAVSQGLIGKDGSIGAVVKTVTGLLLTFTIMQPLGRMEFPDMDDLFSDIQMEAESAAALGETERTNALSQVIKQETEAYILDKAQELHLTLSVQVAVSNGSIPTPIEVTLSGDASPYAKLQINRILIEDLGIDEGNISWI